MFPSRVLSRAGRTSNRWLHESLRLRYGRRAAALAFSALLSIGPTAGAEAAEPTWIKLQNSRFGVISQLDEDDTRKWAVEFDQFIDALQQLYSYEGDLGLPPLTIVLFAQARTFAPYRLQTESGQTKVAGFFGNLGTWSVIGLPGRQTSVDTRRVIYHEPVHWFASGDDVASPTWLEEGLAEVFSTFEVVNGKGRWGNVAQNNVDYLGAYGLLPLDEFLRMSQDEALHGSPKYYPEAWAFVHYLVFGNNGAERARLGDFVRRARTEDLDTAFTASFGKSYAEMTSALRGYLQRGRYMMADIAVRDRGSEMIVGPASPAQVEFALARVAFAGGNDELARKHIDAVRALAPKSAPVYELLALLAARAQDGPALQSALDQAIAFGSEDSTIYSMKGFDLVEDQRNENPGAGGALSRSDRARGRRHVRPVDRAAAAQSQRVQGARLRALERRRGHRQGRHGAGARPPRLSHGRHRAGRPSRG